MCILKKIAIIQRNLMSKDIPKSGYNNFAGFKYHELEDLIPPITRECFEQELILLFDFTDSEAILKITNWNDAKDFIPYKVPMPEIREMNKKMNIMQSEGSYITYLKKYLLINAFLIMEKSSVEQINRDDHTHEEKNVSSKPVKNNSDVVPNCIIKAIQRVTSKGIEINRKTIYAHVNWKQISDEEKNAAKDYINQMEA